MTPLEQLLEILSGASPMVLFNMTMWVLGCVVTGLWVSNGLLWILTRLFRPSLKDELKLLEEEIEDLIHLSIRANGCEKGDKADESLESDSNKG